jgi:MSHA biogenesis protein MshJ
MNQLSQIFKQFMTLKMRERVLAVVAFLGVLYFLFDLTLLGPQRTQAKELRAKLVEQEATLAGYNTALQALVAAKDADPLAPKRAERDALRATLTQAEAVMGRASADTRMGEVVRTLVASTPGVALVSFKTLPVEALAGGVAAVAVAPAGAASGAMLTATPLFKHGVEVTLKGKYVDLIPYLQGLERNASGIFWGNVKLTVLAYPDATLTLTVYTLSTRPELPLG